MGAFATWLFLGLVLPQLGVERESLMSERFFRMDRSAHQNPADEWFVRMPKEDASDTRNVSVFVSSGRVSAVVIYTAQFKRDLEEQIEQDSRCKRMKGRGSCVNLAVRLAL